MTKVRLKPPPGETRVGAWLNKSVVSNRELKNQLALVSEGSKGVVTDVRFGKGLTITFERCPCCQISPIMAGVSHEDIKIRMSYEEWENDVYDELVCLFAETGADRELSFDWDLAASVEYEKYLTTGNLLRKPYKNFKQEE